jgi:hypothetical protein
MEILRQNIRKVTVNVQGHEQAMHRLRQSDVHVVVDMSAPRKGKT